MPSDRELPADDATHVWLPSETGESAPSRERPSLPPSPGSHRRLGRFELVERLGSGGMGEVWRAVHTKLRKQVALKLLPAERLADPAAVARFRREIRLISELAHPNIVRFESAGESEGCHYLVMEYVQGVNLEQLVRRLGRLPVAEACQLIGQAAVGLEHVHRRGLVHRDIKPSNLMLATSGAVKILDLGLASVCEPGGEELTASGRTLGTVDYLAPEQAQDSGSVDIRADLYSLGCTLFKLLTGWPPFSGEKYPSPQSVVLAHQNDTPPSVSQLRSDVPRELAAVVARLLAKDPKRRIQTPADVAAALAPFAAGCDVLALLGRIDLNAERGAAADPATVSSADYLTDALTKTSDTPRDRERAGRDKSSRDHRLEAEKLQPSNRYYKRPAVWLGTAGVALAALVLGIWRPWITEPANNPAHGNGETPVVNNSHSEPPTELAVLDWTGTEWPDSLVTSHEFAFDDVKVNITLAGDLDFDPKQTSPADSPTLHGGLAKAEESLLLATNWPDLQRKLTATIEFSQSVKDVSLQIFDIDRMAAGVQDLVVVQGYRGQDPVAPNIQSNSAIRNLGDGKLAGLAASPNLGANSQNGTATFQFPSEIDRIVLEYTSGPDAQQPGVQEIALHDIRFTVAKPFAQPQVLDWDSLHWQNARQHTLQVAGNELRFSLSGDGAMAATPRIALDDSATLAGGAPLPHKCLAWSARWNSNVDASCLAIDFAAPASDVALDVLALDAVEGGYADCLSIVGSYGGELIEPRFVLPGDAVRLEGRSLIGVRMRKPPADGNEASGETSPESAGVKSDAAEKATVVQFDRAITRLLLTFSGQAAAPRGERHAHQQVALGNLRFRPATASGKSNGGPLKLLVPGNANPWLANLGSGTVINADASPGESPVVLYDAGRTTLAGQTSIALAPGSAISLRAAGTVRNRSGISPRGPRGGSQQATPNATNGIDPVAAPLGSLVGVFQSESPLAPRSATPEPAATGFPEPTSDEVLAPAVNRLFFIGDGLASNRHAQTIVVPEGAARLVLGVLDTDGHYNNTGHFEVEVSTQPARPAELVFEPPGPDTEVLLDGKPAVGPATQPTRIAVAPGRHQIEFVRPGGSAARKSVVVGPGEQRTVRLDEPASDLASAIAAERDVLRGRLLREVAGWFWEAAEGRRSLVQLPLVPPDEYKLELEVERTAGTESFGVGFSASGRRALVLFDHLYSGERVAGLMLWDGAKRSFAPGTTGVTLEVGKRVVVEITATADKLQVTCGGRVLPIDWLSLKSGAPALAAADESSYPGALFLHNHQSSFRIHRAALTPLSGVPRPVYFSDPKTEPARYAAELALWKGCTLRLALDDTLVADISELVDLPSRPDLRGVYDRDETRGAALTDADLELLASLPQLTHLDIPRSEITDAGAAHLRSMPGLKLVNVSYSHISDDALAHIGALSQLEMLYLLGTKISDRGAAQLSGLKLRSLGISGTPIGDAGIAQLVPALEQATWVCLCNTQVTGKSLADLARLPNLATLHLGGTQVHAADLGPVEQMPHLKQIRLVGTRLTQQELQEFQKRRPGIELLK